MLLVSAWRLLVNMHERYEKFNLKFQKLLKTFGLCLTGLFMEITTAKLGCRESAK